MAVKPMQYYSNELGNTEERRNILSMAGKPMQYYSNELGNTERRNGSVSEVLNASAILYALFLLNFP